MTTTASRIADPSLAAEGHRRIEWAAQHMPVLHRLAEERLTDGSLRGRRLAVVVHLEAKTACLVLALRAAGAEVVAAGSNPRSTQNAVCAALVERGVEVHARHGVTQAEFTEDLLAVAATVPELVIDDGLELTRRMAEHAPSHYATLAGVSEETTTGVARLRALESEGRLPFPAVAANDARCKHMFDNPYGTGQTTLTALLALTNVLAAGREFCIVGYGWVGKGLARAAHGLGGRITVVEIDPVRALTAHMDGFRVAALADALPDADVVLTATGLIEAVPAEALGLLRDGVLLANAGHHDREIDVPALAAAASETVDARPGVTTYVLDGRRIHVLVDGALVNIAGLDGNPIEIMDLSFSVQALSIHHLASGAAAPGLQAFPAELDDLIARTKLSTLGIELDSASDAQRRFKESWAV
ncbi:MAG: adenosylhomocysteinase [Actinobacteria bacterium]|nr:adenosylhomocysteinase [Actinomycetota bacterium]